MAAVNLFAVKMAAATLAALALVTVSIPAALQAQDKTEPQNNSEKKPMPAAESTTAKSPAPEMLAPWRGPYGGVPPWHLVRENEFTAAFDIAIAEAQADIEKIANDSAEPTFANTIVALETAGRSLERLSTLFGVYTSNLNLGPIPDIERTVMPKLSEHEDKIVQNAKLFARIEAVYQSDEYKRLSPVDQRLAEEVYKQFVRQGAKLSAEDKERLSKINTRLASLFTDFSQMCWPMNRITLPGWKINLSWLVCQRASCRRWPVQPRN